MDNQWKDIFENAEKSPNPGIWEGIESGLSGGGKKAFMIPLAWAAAISMALASTILIWYNTQPYPFDSKEDVVQTSTNSQSINEVSIPTDTQEDTSDLASGSIADAQPQADQAFYPLTNDQETTENFQQEKDSQFVAISTNEDLEVESSNNQSDLIEPIVQGSENREEEGTLENLAPFIQDESDAPQIKEVDQDSLERILQDQYYGPEPEELQPENRKKKRRLWAGLSQGYGGFASNFGGGANILALASEDGSFTLEDALVSEQRSQRGLSERGLFNTALWVGIPMTESLALVTGFGYSRSNYSSVGASYNGELLHFTAEPISILETGGSSYERTDVEGTYDMAFIPIAIDWKLINSQFGLSVQLGPEIGFLLQQRIESEELGISRSTGVGSLYKPIHLRMSSGLVFSYQIKENYQLSLQPRATQALTSVTFSDTSFSSYPLNYSLMFGFRYYFK